MEIELTKIKENSLNPRTNFTDSGIEELSISIAKIGLIEPIIVRKKDSYYEIVVGERRFRAAKKAGLTTISAIVKTLSDDEVIEYNLIENVMREDLTEVEKGRCCKRLMDSYPMKYPNLVALSQHVGVRKETISKWIQTADSVTPEIETYIAPANPDTKRVPDGKVRSYDVYEITRKVKEPKKQLRMVEKIAEKRMPITDLRKVAKKVADQPEKTVDEVFKEIQDKPAELPFRLSHMQPILDNIKIQTSRKYLDSKIKEGAIVNANIWQPHFADLRITKIIRKRLEEFTEEDAKREGGYTLDQFKEVWKKIHGSWNPSDSVNIIMFELEKTKEIQMVL